MIPRAPYRKLSIVIPVYNERYLVTTLLDRVRAAALPAGLEREVLVVDDGSTDGTREQLQGYAAAHPDGVTLLLQERNQGKGAALARGVEAATGDIILWQDADLEYDPAEYPRLLQPILEGDADVVYGSRFLPAGPSRALFFWHSVGNRLITLLSNVFTDLNLSDMETGAKVFRAAVAKSIPLRSRRFGIEPEITAKVAKRGFRIYEVPISYRGRTYLEGKKITWWDGLKAIGVILKYWLIDDAYGGPLALRSLARTHRYHRWLADAIRPYLGDDVLEVGAGIGTLSALLMPRRRYVVADTEAARLSTLANRFFNMPHVEVARVDVRSAEDAEPFAGQMDSVVCTTALARVEDDGAAVRNLGRVLRPGGRLVLVVPRGRGLLGSLDPLVGHRRRYEAAALSQLLAGNGFEVEGMTHLNKAGALAWWLNGRLLRRRRFGKVQLKVFDSLASLLRLADPVLPWGGLSLLAVARRTRENHE